MTEKSILAYFQSMEQAEKAAVKLQALRVNDLSIDRISKYPGDGVERIMNPLTGNFSGLGYLTQDAEFSSDSAAIMGASDITASGMSDGGQGLPTGRNILMTVVTDEREAERAERVIEQHGGLI